MYDHNDLSKAKAHVDRIYQTLTGIYEKATSENRMPTEIAEEIAMSRLK
jgi:hypothetical protein